MVFFNETGSLGVLINSFTINVSGSLFLTFFIILAAIIVIGLTFRIPFDLVVLFTLPITIVFAAYDSTFIGFFALELIYLGIAFSKVFSK